MIEFTAPHNPTNQSLGDITGAWIGATLLVVFLSPVFLVGFIGYKLGQKSKVSS